jgi:hypothetical protein
MNKLKPVYHGDHGLRTLKELVRSYLTITRDQGRVMTRVKAIYRSWAIPCSGKQVYGSRHREHDGNIGIGATNQDFGDGKQRWIELLIPGAESRIALFCPEGFESRIGGFQPVTFRCDNVYATAEALKSRGVKLAAEPKKEIWGTMAKFRDPDGNEFVFSSK